MSVYVMADLHLSTNRNTNKSMEVFGTRWNNYLDKIQKNWTKLVAPDDTVVLPGDFSWALTIEEAKEDFSFVDSLPGRKLLGKGNHDFWWTTGKKMSEFLASNGFSTISFLHNNAYEIESRILCGTRGWFLDEKSQTTVGSVDFDRIVNRELIRFKISLEEASKLRDATGKPMIAFLHFPPVWKDFVFRQMLDLLHEYQVTRLYFGHIHGTYNVPPLMEVEGIRMSLCSADYLNFTPLRVND